MFTNLLCNAKVTGIPGIPRFLPSRWRSSTIKGQRKEYRHRMQVHWRWGEG